MCAQNATHSTLANKNYWILLVELISSVKNTVKRLNKLRDILLFSTKNTKKALSLSAFLVLAFLLLTPSISSATPTIRCSLDANDKTDETVTISHVYDGDTVKLSDGRKLRLIGINTPETRSKYKTAEPFGRQARDFLRKLIKKSNTVQIRYGAQKKDRYGRLLAHVFLSDGRNISAMMLQFGLARSLHVPPNDWRFRCYDQLDKRAQRRKIGLWNHPFYKTINLDASNLPLGKAYKSTFTQVSGVVSRIDDSKNNIWINLGAQFVLRINKSNLAAFNTIDFNSLLGKKITARGYRVYYPKRKQFRMLVRHPIALTQLN